MLETLIAPWEAQWREMKVWLEEKENVRDMYHQDNILWGKGIMDMVARAMVETPGDRNDQRKADTERGGLKARIHADLTLTVRSEMPEERQQLQP
jgi:hypothetical protein